MKKTILLPLLALGLITGCASTSKVNKLSEDVAANKQAIDKIQYEVARQEEEIKILKAKGSNDSIDGVSIKDIVVGQQYQLEQLNKLLTKARKDLYRHLSTATDGSGLTGDSTQIDISASGFHTGSAKLNKTAFAALDSLVPQLKQNTAWLIKVVGHTDNVGGAAVNKKLSLERAGAVKAYLVKKGVAKTRISTQGVSATKPAACNDTEAGRAKNRRIEVVIKK